MNTMRAEKTTRNADDFKVLFVGAIFALLLITGIPFSQRIWDMYISDRPFITATVEIRQDVIGEPYIMYDADANQDVTGTWIASLQEADGTQILTRHGQGSYTKQEDDPKRWTWFAWFDNEKGLNSPGVPNVPFRACVRYAVETRDTDIHDNTADYCSNLFTPRK